MILWRLIWAIIKAVPYMWFRPNLTGSGNTGGQDITRKLHKEFGITPIRGFRHWFVCATPDGLRLRSVHYGHVWDLENTAQCKRTTTPVPTHDAPNISCSCGFYVFHPDHPYDQWDHMRRGRVSAVGYVDMWGRIIECDYGWKAQHVRFSDEPIVLETSCEASCDNTPTKVRVADFEQPVWMMCDDHASDEYVIPADLWMEEAKRQLESRYGVEVLYWKEPPWQT